MTAVRIRPSTPDDLPGLLRVWSLTYNDAEPFKDELKVFSHSSPFVAEQDGEIVGAFGVMPMTATRGPALMKCAASSPWP